MGSAHDRGALDHARPVDHKGRVISVAAAEDVVLYKLQAWRPHDKIDAINLVRGVKGFDAKYVESWLDEIAKKTGAPMRERWEELLHFPPGPT